MVRLGFQVWATALFPWKQKIFLRFVRVGRTGRTSGMLIFCDCLNISRAFVDWSFFERSGGIASSLFYCHSGGNLFLIKRSSNSTVGTDGVSALFDEF